MNYFLLTCRSKFRSLIVMELQVCVRTMLYDSRTKQFDVLLFVEF